MRLIDPDLELHSFCERCSGDVAAIFCNMYLGNGGCKYARLFPLLQVLQEMIEPMSVSEGGI